jgi:hypothetical protein
MNMNELPYEEFKVSVEKVAAALKDAEDLILHDPKYENVVLQSRDFDKEDTSNVILRFKGEPWILEVLKGLAKTWH